MEDYSITPKELVKFISEKEYMTTKIMTAQNELRCIPEIVIRTDDIENAYNCFFAYMNEIMTADNCSN